MQLFSVQPTFNRDEYYSVPQAIEVGRDVRFYFETNNIAGGSLYEFIRIHAERVEGGEVTIWEGDRTIPRGWAKFAVTHQFEHAGMYHIYSNDLTAGPSHVVTAGDAYNLQARANRRDQRRNRGKHAGDLLKQRIYLDNEDNTPITVLGVKVTCTDGRTKADNGDFHPMSNKQVIHAVIFNVYPLANAGPDRRSSFEGDFDRETGLFTAASGGPVVIPAHGKAIVRTAHRPTQANGDSLNVDVLLPDDVQNKWERGEDADLAWWIRA